MEPQDNGYSQWIAVSITPAYFSLEIQNVQLKYGRFYQYPDKDKEVPMSEINHMRIVDGQTGMISSCGRKGSPTGTEGGFDVYDGSTLVGTFEWDCPFSGQNTASWTPKNKNYSTQVSPISGEGSIGNVEINIARLKTLDEPQPNGYDQWISVAVKAEGCDLHIQNAEVKYGKFYLAPDKDNEVSASRINSIKIPASGSAQISACGRSMSPTGTEGQFDIFDGSAKVGTFKWNCPYSQAGGPGYILWEPNILSMLNHAVDVSGGPNTNCAIVCRKRKATE